MSSQSLPIVSAGDKAGLWQACSAGGLFYLVDHGIKADLMEQVIEISRSFFDLDQAEKERLSIKNSPQHRGYGMLKNYRDWREQIHIGVEAPAGAPAKLDRYTKKAHFWKLWGPNQWPSAEFQSVISTYLKQIDNLSRRLLSDLAIGLQKDKDHFEARMLDRPYLLMKAISYLPQECESSDSENEVHTGVPAHCDWSWPTLLIQDDVGGLEAQGADGLWHQVTPLAESIVVNTGELLEIETGGILPANPHRVLNARIDRQRISIPVFINPSLDAAVYQAREIVSSQSTLDDEKFQHVHRVIKPGTKIDPFLFGDREFDRKDTGNWCYRPQCRKVV